MKKWVVTDPETLRTLCIKNNWFTCGTNRQYEKMFDMNRIEKGHASGTIRDIIIAIWLCSDGASFDEVYDKIHEANDDYRMDFALAQQAERERAADEVYCGYYD